MKRGDIYRVYKATSYDPKRYRLFVIVSRQVLVDSRFATVICAPIYSRYDGLSTQVRVSIEEGLKRESNIHCDELVSISKRALTYYIGFLSVEQMMEVDEALQIALALKI